jgi:hypothetical protein
MTQGRRRQPRFAATLLAVVSLGTLVAAAPVWAAATPRPVALAYARGHLTGRLDGVPFDQALAALAQALPVPFTIKGSVGREPVSIALDRADVESALRQLLRGRSYVAVYGEDVAAPGVPRIVEIVVVGERGTGEGHAERGAAHVPESVAAEP